VPVDDDRALQPRDPEGTGESERRFRELIDGLPQIVWIAGPDGTVEYFNRAWQEHTGLEAPEPGRSNWTHAMHPDDLAAASARWHAAVSAAAPFETENRVRRRDGQYRWHLVRAMPIPDERGRVVRWFGTFTDVHDAKVGEARLRAVVEATAECVKIVSPDGRLVQMNPAGIRMIEADDESAVIGRDILPFVAPEYRDEWLANHALVCAGESRTWQFEIVGLKGTRRWMETHAVPLALPGGGQAQLAVARDVTERKRAESERDQLLEAERTARSEAERASRLKDEFLATLSHELRTPLNAILGWSHMLRDIDRGRHDVLRGLDVIARNARAQSQIIDDLLDMSRIISGKIHLEVQPLHLHEIVNNAIDAVRQSAVAKGIRIHPLLDSSIGLVRGDPNRLQQVLWNLLSNAVKFTPQGGRVQVVLERVNSHVEIVVEDTGIGIRSDFLPYVFDRFRQADPTTTRRYGGLGLGLSIVKNLVELHGGSVRVKSPGEGQGSTFIVMLPVSHVRAEDAVRTQRPSVTEDPLEAIELPRLDGVSVLIVDDEPDGRGLIARILEGRGAIPTCATSAAEALEILAQKSYNVLLSDIGMAEMDGYELIRRVRALSASGSAPIPAIAVTAYARPEDRQRSLLAGYQMHLAKPIEARELVAGIASLLQLTR
jgi:PAS domain S-box-containing protein